MAFMRRGLAVVLLCVLALATGSARAEQRPAQGQFVEVVVGLAQAPLATTRWAAGRQLQTRTLVSSQQALVARIQAELPAAQVRWRYRLVANGLAVVLPRSQLSRLSSLPGVARVYPSVRYRAQLDRSPAADRRADALGARPRRTRGTGSRSRSSTTASTRRTRSSIRPGSDPPGFPKGQTAFTTPKVIVARPFPPAAADLEARRQAVRPGALLPRDARRGDRRGQRRHVAQGGARISGVAPRAYLGNYKALTIPTDADVGLDGNSPELAAAIEAAVADGMDVINLSLGEPEIEPSRDIVVLALERRGPCRRRRRRLRRQRLRQFGRGSVGSPGVDALGDHRGRRHDDALGHARCRRRRSRRPARRRSRSA